MEGLVWAAVNLGLFVAILFFLLKGKVQKLVAERHATIKSEVIEVRDQLQKAKNRLSEFTSKLRAVDMEVTALGKQAKEDAIIVKSKVINVAKEKSGALIEEARSHAGTLFGDLREELIIDLAHKVMEKTEQNLKGRLTGEEKKRIRREFTASLNGSQRVRGEA